MSDVQPAQSEREWADRDWEDGAILLLRSRESGKASDAASLRDWIGEDPSRGHLILQIERCVAEIDGLGDEPEIKSWLDEAHAARTTTGFRASRSYFGARAAWAMAASLVIAIFAGAMFEGGFFHPAPAGELIESGVGERKRLQLADGTTIVMDAGSTIRVAYTNEVRQTELLRGQAHFEVTHDPERPFHVRLGDREVVVLGTDFNVLRDKRVLQVSLFRGKVAIAGVEDRSSLLGLVKSTEHTPLQTLSPGQQYEQGANRRPTLSKFDPFAVSAWEKGLVVFDNTSLDDAAGILNRRATKPLSVGSDLGSRRVSGVFRSGDTVTFANVVAGFYPHTKVEETDSEVILSD